MVFQNLKNSFPEKDQPEIKLIAKKFYRNLSDILLETLKEITISKEEIDKRIKVYNAEDLMSNIKNGKSVIVLASHQCNWELLLSRAGTLTGTPVDVLYKPLSNKSMDNFMVKIRSRFGGFPIDIKDTSRKIAGRRHITRMVAILADQTPTLESEVYWTQFMNQETAFYKGPDVLARFTRYPVYYAEMVRVNRGYYQVNVKKIAEPPYEDHTEILPSFIKMSEQTIIENPADWLWSHRRWKLKKGTE